MNKEKLVFAASLLLMALAAAATAASWKEEVKFKPPSSRLAASKIEAPKAAAYFSDEDDAVSFPADRRNLFQPTLETVDLPPAVLPPPPLPDRKRAGPPPFPEPGYADLSAVSEPCPPAGTDEGGKEEPGKEEGTGEKKRW